MMKTTRRGRPYAKDTHDLFATLIVSLQLTTHRQFFRTYTNSFTTDEAAENLSALKFSQSNRAPDPREPSRVVTTTTTTTFSMNREMAKGICQHFMDARLIENAADLQSGVFKDKGVYQLTPKGLHILERFITKNGINAEHLLKVFASQPICMKLLHLERRAHDDELLINRPILQVIFRRFSGRQPNYLPGTARSGSASPSSTSVPLPSGGANSSSNAAQGSAAARSSSPGSRGNKAFDATLGIGVQDIIEKVKGKKEPVRIKHVFTAIAVLDWLVDFTTICGRDEAAEIAAHFQRLGYVHLVKDASSRRDDGDDSTVIARGEDGIGRVSEGQFKCHYKCMYGVTDRGRSVARWPGYVTAASNPEQQQTSTMDSGSQGGGTGHHHSSQQNLTPSSSEVNLPRHPGAQRTSSNSSIPRNHTNGNDIESLQSANDSLGGDSSAAKGPSAPLSRESSQYRTSMDQQQGPGQPSKSVSTVPFKSQKYVNNNATAQQQAADAGLTTAPTSPTGRGTSRDTPFVPFIKPSAAEKLRNDYVSRAGAPTGHAEFPYRDSNTNRLKQILEEPALRSLFRDFLKQNFCEENLSFWLDVQDFKRRFHTTSSAVAVRPGDGASSTSTGKRRGLFNRASSNLNRSGTSGGGDSSDGGNSNKDLKSRLKKRNAGATQGVTAMEKHQQDLIAMAFVIYNTYLAQASPCELNIEHNLRTELVTYMNRVLKEAKANAGENGVQTVRAKDLPDAQKMSTDSGSSRSFSFRGGLGDDGGLAAALAAGPGGATNSTGTSVDTSSGGPASTGVARGFIGRSRGATSASNAGTNASTTAPNLSTMNSSSSAPQHMSVEERKSTVSASMPRYPLHASQLQTMVRLYERIQDHIFRLMATDSVPRFIKDARFLGLVKSVAEYTEALESGQLDPNDVSGPAISQNVVDAMELGIVNGSRGAAAGNNLKDTTTTPLVSNATGNGNGIGHGNSGHHSPLPTVPAGAGGGVAAWQS
ncbi:unnamed protein product [Sympodiomycopsis kandeliae]